MRRGSRWEIKIHREQSRRRRIRVTAALREPVLRGPAQRVRIQVKPSRLQMRRRLRPVSYTHLDVYKRQDKNGKAEAVAVKAGRTENGRTEILDGLSEGDKIVSDPYEAGVENGERVRNGPETV